MWKINKIETESKSEECSTVIRDLDSSRDRENEIHIQIEEELTALSN